MTGPVHSNNEWEPLREVIVGSVQGAVYPEHGPLLAAQGDPGWLWRYQGTLVEEDLVEAAQEQLDGLVKVLRQQGVTVHRPDPQPHNLPYESPWWRCRGGWNSANPRDLFLVVGDTILECASPLRHRYFEPLAYHRLMTDYLRRGARWLAAPRPMLHDALYDHGPMAAALAGQPPRHPEALPPGQAPQPALRELEPVFEAADFVRCDEDIFMIHSQVTNSLGLAWVRRALGPAYKVHVLATRCPKPCHIDTTFLPLAPGKALVHPAWLVDVPEALKHWTLIPAPRPVYAEDSPMASPYFTSQWLSMNVLSLDEQHIFVDEQQEALMRLLDEHGFTPIPLPFDCVGAFGGSFHCATLDIRRGA